MNEELKHREIYLDHLRVLATVAVMILHVAGENWGSVDVNGSEWRVFNFYDSAVRWAVPIFVMISGALFLDRNDITIKKLYTKYVLRMMIAYFTWSIFYYVFSGDNILQQLLNLIKAGKTDKFIAIINSHYHLWFILMIVGLYICLPIIRQIVKNEEATDYFLIVSFVIWIFIPEIVVLINDFGGEKFISITNAFYEKVKGLQLNFVMNYAFYFILGYKLSKIRFDKKKRILIYILGVFGFIFTVVIDWIVSLKAQMPMGTYYGDISVNVLFETMAIFELYKNISFKNIDKSRIIIRLSKWSFGAYLVHALIIEQLRRYGIHTLAFSPVISVPIIVVVVFACAFAISGCIHCIPVLKKYIV